jgi:hypothetical protein
LKDKSNVTHDYSTTYFLQARLSSAIGTDKLFFARELIGSYCYEITAGSNE